MDPPPLTLTLISVTAAPKPGVRGGSVVLKRMPAVKIENVTRTTVLRTDAEVGHVIAPMVPCTDAEVGAMHC